MFADKSIPKPSKSIVLLSKTSMTPKHVIELAEHKYPLLPINVLLDKTNSLPTKIGSIFSLILVKIQLVRVTGLNE